jgi:hypothetical protein
MTDSLNVQIALALGWTVYKKYPSWWVLRNTEGQDVGVMSFDPSDRWQHVPDYEHSLDACAAALPVHLELEFEYARFHADTHMAWIYVPEEDDILGEGATRAEALAHALLAWAMVQRGNGPLAEKGNGDER